MNIFYLFFYFKAKNLIGLILYIFYIAKIIWIFLECFVISGCIFWVFQEIASKILVKHQETLEKSEKLREFRNIKKPGIVLLSHALRHSTITARDFRFPVRNGMERTFPAMDTRQIRYWCLLYDSTYHKFMIAYLFYFVKF